MDTGLVLFLRGKPVTLEEILCPWATGELIIQPQDEPFFALNYNIGVPDSHFYLFLKKDPEIQGSVQKNRCHITARSISPDESQNSDSKNYESLISRYTGYPGSIVKDPSLITKKVIEIAPGLSELACYLAVEKRARGLPRMVIIDPIDYKAIQEVINFTRAFFPGHSFNVSETFASDEEISRRLSVLSDPNYVEHYKVKIDENRSLPYELSHLRGSADAVFDIMGAFYYSGQKKEVRDTALALKKRTGILIQF